jgi:hypothetical protein
LVYYFASTIYHQTILTTINESEEVIIGQQADNHVEFLKYIKKNIITLNDIDYLIVDLSAIDDLDEDILQAFKMFRTLYDETRCIIVAPYRKAGDMLLSQLFALGIWNIVATNDYLEMKKGLEVCLSEKGMSFKEGLIFKDVKKTEDVSVNEIKAVSRVMIGIVGSQKRIGTTHSTVMLAGALRKKGYMVAVVEFNQSGAFQKIREDFGEKYHDHFYFILNGIDYFPDVNRETFQKVLEKSYNFIVIDFGNYQECNMEEYHKCHVRMICAGSKAWELEHAASIMQHYDDEILKHIHFYFNFTDKNYQKPIKKQMKNSSGEKLNVHFLEYESDPFNTEVFPEIDQLLSEYLKVPVKKKYWFGLKKNK